MLGMGYNVRTKLADTVYVDNPSVFTHLIILFSIILSLYYHHIIIIILSVDC